MKILSAADIRLWDQYTIEHSPISSIGLMEKAAIRCVDWLEEHYSRPSAFHIFCGKGNNGGDGLAIARLLANKKTPIVVHILEFGHKGTDEFQANLARLHQYPAITIRFIQSSEHFHPCENSDIIIDSLFGSGLNRPLEGVTAQLVDFINQLTCPVISIDIPSGLFTDGSSRGNHIIKARHTLSFQCYKAAFMLAENADYIGNLHIVDIGLHPDFLLTVEPIFELVDMPLVLSIYKPRNNFSHKGDFGHALLIAGSYGKMGAAVLSAIACLRSGVGLLTCHIPKAGYDIMQTSVPEAMALTDFNTSFITNLDDDPNQYDAIGIGPGIGTAAETKTFLKQLLKKTKAPLVLDADALNSMAAQKELLSLIPANSILTPHPKEFERLFGKTDNEMDRIQLAMAKAKELQLVIVLKGHHTLIATPQGKGYFNSTGNAGMATAGSGDTLTGILTALLAQGYGSIETALLGVYLHGLAGDLAAQEYSMEAMIASDISAQLGHAFDRLQLPGK